MSPVPGYGKVIHTAGWASFLSCFNRVSEMHEYTVAQSPGKLSKKMVRPPGNNSPPFSKEARIANWLSAPLFSFDSFLQRPLSKDGRCWGKLSEVIRVFFDSLHKRIKNRRVNKKFTFPDGFVSCYHRQASSTLHCRSPPLLKSGFFNFRNGG